MSDTKETVRKITESNVDIVQSVYEAIAVASMCWKETPTGVFDGERARKIADDLIATIRGIK